MLKTSMRQIHALLCEPKLLHFMLPILMLYLVAGTIAQKYIGLYEATSIFFSSPIIWLGIVPLPGMPVIIALVFFNLSFKLLFKSPWDWKNSGIIVAHIGAMLLIFGGLISSLMNSEGYIALPEGQSSNIISDYHQREFAILSNDGETLATFNHLNIDIDKSLNSASLPFTITPIDTCRNCEITARVNAGENHIGMAQHMQISPAKLKVNNEENMAGITFQVNENIYTVLESVPKIPTIKIGDKEFHFTLRRNVRKLPFSIQLIDFEKQSYPGTDKAKSYRSSVIIKDGDLSWESEISMNKPLRYKGYSFFQSSFIDNPTGEISVLAVVWNAGRSFPYISGLLMCLGLVAHLFLRTRRKAIIAALCLPLMLASIQAQANDTNLKMDLNAFAQIPILDEGRIKPIDSFARSMRKKLTGRENGALIWLVETLFDPARAASTPTIKITHPDVIALLELAPSKNRLYSYEQLYQPLDNQLNLTMKILQSDEGDWSTQHRALIDLQEKAALFRSLTSSMSVVLPLNIKTPDDAPYNLRISDERELNYLGSLSFREKLDAELKKIIALKKDNIESYDPLEQLIAHISFTLSSLEKSGQSNHLFKIIADNTSSWISPWDVVLRNTEEEAKEALEPWRKLAYSYHESNIIEWNETVHELQKSSSSNKLKVEYLYNQIAPFYWGCVLCIISTLALMIGAITRKNAARIALPCIALAFILQLSGLAMRIYILERPPVSTLYETILFVNAITMLYGLWLFVRTKKTSWLWLCTILGVVLHLLSFSHSQDNDNLVMLSAVLNTDFWLTTHVLSITTGYGFCAITSLLAHYALAYNAWKKTENESLFKSTHNAALLALFFVTIGTILGGIWADQSWGRFWGWDPKENGALLIILWLLWVVHGRIAKQIGTAGSLCVYAYLSVILALSWFGVNLLGVGLHSYGFTNFAAIYLSSFIALESAFLIVIMILIKQRGSSEICKN